MKINIEVYLDLDDSDHILNTNFDNNCKIKIDEKLKKRKSKLALKLKTNETFMSEYKNEVLSIPINYFNYDFDNYNLIQEYIGDKIILIYNFPKDYQIQNHFSITENIKFLKNEDYIDFNFINDFLRKAYFYQLNIIGDRIILESNFMLLVKIFNDSLNGEFGCFDLFLHNPENILLINLNNPKLHYDNIKPIIRLKNKK